MSKEKIPFVPPFPCVDMPSEESSVSLPQMTRKEKRQFKKSVAHKKYVQPVLDREKNQKKQARKDWWWNKGVVILNTILALIAAITGIVALLR